LREHISEKQKPNDYAINLSTDLKEDKTELTKYLKYYRFGSAATDTLIQLLSATDPKNIPSGKLYWYGLFGGLHGTFTSHNATLPEMKSSGSLRFFGDKIISRKLAQYDELCRNMETNETNEVGIYNEVRKARAQIFEFKYNAMTNDIYSKTRKVNNQALIDSFKKINPPLLSYDKIRFNEYVEMIRSRFFSAKIASADTLLHHGNELIGLLNKKYDTGDK